MWSARLKTFALKGELRPHRRDVIARLRAKVIQSGNEARRRATRVRKSLMSAYTSVTSRAHGSWLAASLRARRPAATGSSMVGEQDSPTMVTVVDGTSLKERLAAILAADVAGYSRLMALDDRATVAALDAARQVFRAQVESNHGRVIDMAGDSVLAVFETAAGAVAAAIAVQQDLGTLERRAARSADALSDRRSPG